MEDVKAAASANVQGKVQAAPAAADWRSRILCWRAALPASWSPKMIGGVAAAALAVVAVAGVGLWLLLHPGPAPAPIDLPRAGAAPAGDGGPATQSGVAATDPATGAATITVAAGGAVSHPGVYVVPSKARVADVVAAAGGTLPDADLDQVNLAAKVADADRVFVPRRGQPVPPVAAPDGASGGSSSASGGGGAAGKGSPVDLNTATAEQLDALPGVGPATAQAILSYRSAHGKFKSVNDLLEVRGIGPAKFEALRPLVRV